MGHHFVPQFLLRHWSDGGRFVAHFWHEAACKVIVNAKASVASACQVRNLNTLFGVPSAQKDFPETNYFTPKVDTPAYHVLKVMLDKGVRALSFQQRTDWARLLVSFGMRLPETLRELGPRHMREALELSQANAKGPPELEKKATLLLQGMMPVLERNMPLKDAIEMSSDPAKLGQVVHMQWWLRHFDRSCLLIGDRPLLAYPRMQRPCGIPLNNSSCLIALPITPNIAFFSSSNSKTKAKMRRIAPGKLARILNEETIFQSQCIYFRDRSMASFIEPRLVGKAAKTWKPS